MRLTNNTLLRGYNRSLNRLKVAKNDCEQKITSQRKFSRASDAPLSAAKALNVRKSQYYSEQHKENLKVASKFYTEAETSLLQVSEKMAQIREIIIAACNTTKDSIDYSIYSQQLETYAKELCAIFNTDSAGRSIFGGESDDAMPFEIINDSNGRPSTVLYQGVPVNSLNDFSAFPYSNKVYVDVGLGMRTDQAEHTTDPMSVLDISFNGAEITGCGAESSVADIDLSSIKEGRQYVFDIYCDGIKKTIDFIGASDAQSNVQMINDKLKDAYRKDIVYGKNYPVMDEKTGIVYSVDTDGNPVDGGLVSIVNNTVSPKSKRAEALVIDNDSGYTDKFRLKAGVLMEDTIYKVDVKVGDVTKTVEFISGNDDGAAYREDVTLQNFQEALNEAFGEGVVNVSMNDPVKGIVSAEGKKVELVKAMADDVTADIAATENNAKLTIVEGDGWDRVNFNSMRFEGAEDDFETYNFNIDSNKQYVSIKVKANGTKEDILQAFRDALGENSQFTIDNNGVVKSKFGNTPVKLLSNPSNGVSTQANYKVDPDSIKAGQSYFIKVVDGSTIKNVKFTATKDGDYADLQNALDAAFNKSITIQADGTLTSMKSNSISITNNLETDNETLIERERIFSQNYIQLTLDAARALRNNDIEYANACIDRIVTANEHLLVEIADLGCNEDFIDFNIERITTRETNLAERQNDLEAADPEYMITLWKQFEAYYNACLQMSSSVIPNSIFNYMK